WTSADVLARALCGHGLTSSGHVYRDGSPTGDAFAFRLPLLPPSPRPGHISTFDQTLTYSGLKPGNYTLLIDDKKVITASAADWAKGVKLPPGFDSEQVEKLRATIIEKNQTYFHRWRPQNETYLFGFRKGEQGKNAVEIPQFDPLVEDLEKEIAVLRMPARHT